MSRIFEALQRMGVADPGVSSGAAALDSLVRALRPEESQSLGPMKPQMDEHASAIVPSGGRIEPIAGDSTLVAWWAEQTLSAEKFRVLATRLMQIQQKQSMRSLLVTSAAKEEGKSLVTINLAFTIARRTKQRVLMMDADLRRPTLAGHFKRSIPRGIAEWWSGSRLDDCLYSIADTSLALFPATRPYDHPLEIFQSERFRKAVQSLSHGFDWIVFDAPPMVPFAESALLSSLCDGTILIARRGKTSARLFKKAVDGMDRARLLGVVLNDCDEPEHDYYSKYGSQTSTH